jgi:hypothetical protein
MTGRLPPGYFDTAGARLRIALGWGEQGTENKKLGTGDWWAGPGGPDQETGHQPASPLSVRAGDS